MWYAIVSFIVIVLGWFFYDRNRMEKSLTKQGGMSVIFEQLISLIMEGEPNCRIIKEQRSSVYLSASTGASMMLIEILMTFKKVTITYRTDSIAFGKHKLRWEFKANEDQEFIFYKMNSDIGTYLKNDKRTGAFYKALYDPDSDLNV